MFKPSRYIFKKSLGCLLYLSEWGDFYIPFFISLVSTIRQSQKMLLKRGVQKDSSSYTIDRHTLVLNNINNTKLL